MRVEAYGGNGIGDDRNLDSFKGLAMGNTRNGVKKAYDKSKYGFVIVFVGVFHKVFVCLFFVCKYTKNKRYGKICFVDRGGMVCFSPLFEVGWGIYWRVEVNIRNMRKLG